MNFISPYTFSRSFPFARYVRKNDTFSFGGFLGVVGGSLGVFGGCFVILGVFGGSELIWGIFGGSSHPEYKGDTALHSHFQQSKSG